MHYDQEKQVWLEIEQLKSQPNSENGECGTCTNLRQERYNVSLVLEKKNPTKIIDSMEQDLDKEKAKDVKKSSLKNSDHEEESKQLSQNKQVNPAKATVEGKETGEEDKQPSPFDGSERLSKCGSNNI